MESDAITITFYTTKSDKAGERTVEKKHIYASVKIPEVCTWLAFALFIWLVIGNLFFIN